MRSFFKKYVLILLSTLLILLFLLLNNSKLDYIAIFALPFWFLVFFLPIKNFREILKFRTKDVSLNILGFAINVVLLIILFNQINNKV